MNARTLSVFQTDLPPVKFFRLTSASSISNRAFLRGDASLRENEISRFRTGPLNFREDRDRTMICSRLGIITGLPGENIFNGLQNIIFATRVPRSCLQNTQFGRPSSLVDKNGVTRVPRS